MLLKRVYDPITKKITHLKAIRLCDVQKFSTKFIEEQTANGVLSIVDGKIILKTAPNEADIVYRIVTGPGFYCCHDNKKLSSSRQAARYVLDNFKDVKSPDPNNPAGFRQDHCYTCILKGLDLIAEEAEAMVQEQRRKVIENLGAKYRKV